jgi:hypothetical protein|eukprot:COSAG06_NODE_33335_length_491_cov_1.056122_1_plen_90_part_00
MVAGAPHARRRSATVGAEGLIFIRLQDLVSRRVATRVLLSTQLTYVPSELMQTVPRGHLTVEPGDSDYAAWMALATKTPTAANPVHTQP